MNEAHLGTSDTNFRSSIDMNTAMCLPRDRTSDSVNDTDAKRAPLQATPHRQNTISRLSALTQENTNVISQDRSLPIQEVTRQLDGDRNLRELFEDGTSGKKFRMRRRRCGDHGE
jgi:hypothetical protein